MKEKLATFNDFNTARDFMAVYMHKHPASYVYYHEIAKYYLVRSYPDGPFLCESGITDPSWKR